MSEEELDELPLMATPSVRRADFLMTLAYATDLATGHSRDFALMIGLDQPVDREAILALEPAPHGMLDEPGCEEAYLAIADMIDMRMPCTFGHSRAVAALAEAAGKRLDLPSDELRALRWAAYAHGALAPVPQRTRARFTRRGRQDFDRFLKIFSTKGAEKRKQHGSKGAAVFRDPVEIDRVWVIFDWDEEGFKNFVSDPEVPAILKEAGHVGKPQPAILGGRFGA